MRDDRSHVTIAAVAVTAGTDAQAAVSCGLFTSDGAAVHAKVVRGRAGCATARRVLRTYLLNAAAKVKRVHWYMWDRPAIGNTKMVTSNGSPSGSRPRGSVAQTPHIWPRQTGSKCVERLSRSS